jgi:hypothetical protein
MVSILDLADNTDEDVCLNNLSHVLMNRIAKEVVGLGGFASQAVLPLAALCGVIVNNLGHAKAAFLARAGAHYDALRELGCDTEQKRVRLVKTLRTCYGMDEAEVENLLCETYRKYPKFDVLRL